MVTTVRQSHAARVGVHAGESEPAAPARRIIVHHHRTPRVEWSIDAATGGHVLHLALAQCVFNNVLRIARDRELSLTNVSVTADGDFNAEETASTGIDCSIELSGDAEQSDLVTLAEAAFGDSTVAAVLRRGASVELTSVRATGR
jgi:uncharacterized OsmC-like protein